MPRFRRCRPELFVCFLILFSPIAGVAQESGFVGTVTDSSGAVLPGATVIAKNVNSGETRQVTSNDVGQYAIPNVQPGSYQVSGAKDGFQRKLVDQVTLEVQSVRTIDLVLSPGVASEQVNVTASATPLQTTESSVSTEFETKLVAELPLNGRDFLQLQLLAPGTTLAPSGTFKAVQIASQNRDIGGGNFSVNGMRDVYNDYIIDGISFKDWMHGTNGMNPSVDAIQEFRLQTSNYSAEFGANAGGMVNMVTKSGSNQIHGNLFEFLRNDKFDATDYFTPAGRRKPPLRRNQFGGTVGGPIRRNETFFFFSYEGFREQSSTTLFNNFPTLPMRSGDFSELLNLPTPIVIHDPATGIPYPNNVIPNADLLAVMPGYLSKYIPLPNRPGLVNNYVVPGTHRNDVNQYIGRVDHQIKPNIQLNGHYIWSKISDNPPTTIPIFSSSQDNNDQNATLHLTDTANSQTVFDLQVGWNSFKQFAHTGLQNTTPDIASDVLGIHGVATDPRASGTPSFITPGFGTLGGGGGPRQWFSERYEYQGSVSLVRGKHLIRAGFHTVRHHETFQEIIIPNGEEVFDGTISGYSMADMLLGIPSEFVLSPELFNPLYRPWELMPWVQDDWRVTPKLTINLGLRYEYRPWPVSKNNTIANIVLPPGGGQASVVVAAPCKPGGVSPCETSLPTSVAPNRSTLDGTDKNNFAPRVGFAYRVGNSDRTVVRGAYGIFYQAEPFNQFIFLSINPPFVSYYDKFINKSNYQTTWDFYHPTAGLPPGGVQYTYIPANSRTPYLQAWNFGIQHDFGDGFVLNTTYVGNKDTKLWARTWPNQPRPGPGNIDSRRPYTDVSTINGNEAIGNANYNGWQTRLDKRFSQGLSILAGYTWSKAITDTQTAETGAFVPDLQDNNNRRANRGLTASDTRNRFTMSTVYELPFGNKRRYLPDVRGVVGKIVSGWQIGAIATFQSGQPTTATLAFDNSNTGDGAKLPNLVGNPNNGPKTVNDFFNTSAFALPPQYTFGNEGIDVINGPDIRDVDISLVKNTPIWEQGNLQFRCEAFNVANHPIWAQPHTTFGTPQFGEITSTRLANREIQFALKLSFLYGYYGGRRGR